MNEHFDYLVKIIVVGNPNVGKSSLSSVLTNSKFSLQYEITIGVDFFSVYRQINNNVWKMHIWDTAGQETFRSITSTYYKDSAICLLVFDISSKSTFNNLKFWKEEIEKYNNNPYFVLIGNKKDLNREVSFDTANNWANENNMIYYETSAKHFKQDFLISVLQDFDKNRDKNNHTGVKDNTVENIENIENIDLCGIKRNKFCC